MDQEFTSGQLMAAILDLRKTTEDGFAMMYGHFDSRFDRVEARLAEHDTRFDDLEYKMNRRFDSVDLRFDAFERRVSVLEERDPR